MIELQELNGDQSRETVNTAQRYTALSEAQQREIGYRGSMSFAERGGTEYLLRDYYDPVSGVRRQKSLGPRNADTQKTFDAFVHGKADAIERRRSAAETIQRQAAVNRALRLGRVPDIAARIVRAL